MLVAGSAFEFAQVRLDLVAGRGAGGQPERQTGADQRVGVEQVELASEAAVIDGHGYLLGFVARRKPHGSAERPRASRPGPLRRLRSGQRDATPGRPGVVVTDLKI